jgi:Na+-driven multidrug efflux pump
MTRGDSGKGDAVPIKFLPIFLVATLSVMIDEIQMMLHEAIVGNLFDDAAFSAFNLVEPYSLLVSFVAYLICVGGASLIVRAKGAGDQDGARKLYNHSVTCCLVAGLAFFLVYSVFAVPLVRLVAEDSPAYPYALDIFYWLCFFNLLYPLYTFLFTYILYIGRKWVSLLSILLELVLSTVLSLYLGRLMGVGGTSLATAISQLITVLFLCGYIIYTKQGIRYRPYINPAYIKRLCLLGLPESSLMLVVAVMEAGVNALALKRYSIQGVTVVAMVINLFVIVGYVSEGVSEYETVALNWAIGKGDRDQIRYGMRVTFLAGLIEGLAFSLLFLLGAPAFADIFGIDDAGTAKITAVAIRILAIAPIGIIVCRVTAIFHQYTNKVGQAALIFLCAIGLIPLALAAVLSPVSLEALVLGIALGPVVTVGFMWICPLSWNRNKPIDLRRTTVVFREERL